MAKWSFEFTEQTEGNSAAVPFCPNFLNLFTNESKEFKYYKVATIATLSIFKICNNSEND